jgi:signal-transduction protein with cAMP-binding, CBS, and nucleotidyltransferase domain
MSSVVLAVGPGHTLRETATKMTEKGTGAALVFDDESPAPRIITERDISTRSAPARTRTPRRSPIT